MELEAGRPYFLQPKRTRRYSFRCHSGWISVRDLRHFATYSLENVDICPHFFVALHFRRRQIKQNDRDRLPRWTHQSRRLFVWPTRLRVQCLTWHRRVFVAIRGPNGIVRACVFIPHERHVSGHTERTRARHLGGCVTDARLSAAGANIFISCLGHPAQWKCGHDRRMPR